MSRYIKGFTLIELMIALAIVAILAAIAYPYFQDYVIKSRRSDAMNAITTIQLEQEKWRANNTSFTGTLADVWNGGAGGEDRSTDGYYLLTLAGPSATAYTLTAAPQAKGNQDDDTLCGNFTLTVLNGAATKGNSGSGDTDRCWRK